MKIQNMLPNYREREKIAAGLYDITQVVQFGVGCVVGVIIALITYKITGSIILGLVLMVPCIITGIVFATKKVGELMFLQYLILKSKYKRKIKFYVNSGIHRHLEFSGQKDEVKK